MWLELLDGPAAGEYKIKSPTAPRKLRATTSPSGSDILDSPDDAPRPDEQVHAYQLVRGERRLNRERKEKSGAWGVYSYVPAIEIVIYTDGGGLGNPGPAACAAVVLWKDSRRLIVEHAEMIGEATNNEAEYRGFMLGVRLAKICSATHVDFVTDSELMAKQLAQYVVMAVGFKQQTYATRDPKLVNLHNKIRPMLDDFTCWTISSVPRERNKRADWLCNRILRPDSTKGRAPEPAPGE